MTFLSSWATAEEARAYLRGEQQKIDDRIAGGRRFVTAARRDGRKTVHEVTCPHARRYVDLDEALDYHIRNGSITLEYMIRHGLLPSSDGCRLMTRDEVELLTSYRKCLACAPDTLHQRKDFTPQLDVYRNQTKMMNSEQIGRHIYPLEGHYEGGRIVAITHTFKHTDITTDAGETLTFGHGSHVMLRAAKWTPPELTKENN